MQSSKGYLRPIILVALAFLVTARVHAFENDKVSEKASQDLRFKQIETVNEDYLKSVRPVFERKCFDCHSNATRYPWYHELPFIKGLLDKDVLEAKRHLDLSDDFPFAGHGTIEEDLSAIGKSIDSGGMPPLKYRVLRWETKISSEEKELINKWIQSSLTILSEK